MDDLVKELKAMNDALVTNRKDALEFFIKYIRINTVVYNKDFEDKVFDQIRNLFQECNK